MTLHVAGTGSKANTYVLASRDHALILDAGVPWRTVVSVLPSEVKLDGCLVTHEHMDHARAVRDYTLNRGRRIAASAGTLRALDIPAVTTSLVVVAEPRKAFELGPWLVLPFEVQHDAEDPLGYLIRYKPTGETALYATDTYYVRYRFPGVHYWIIECNFCEELLTGETPQALRKRLLESHMSLRRLKELFEANDLSQAAKIILVHLSDERSDEARMIREIEELTGVETVAAVNGETYTLETDPF